MEYLVYITLGGALLTFLVHTTYTRNNMGQKCEGNCDLWVLNEIIEKKNILKIWKKSCELFGSYLLKSTAPMIFFKFSGYIFFYYFIKNPQITIALPFFTHNISAIGGVCSKQRDFLRYSSVMEGGCGFAAHDCQTQTSYDPACAEQGTVHRR